MDHQFDEFGFPPHDLADADGLLAIGGDLSEERLIHAYFNGIFPWYNQDSPILWWSPDPRFVLFPASLKVSKSMQQVLNRKLYRITYNTAFREVLKYCAQTRRPGQEGTWLLPEMQQAYYRLHKLGLAVSIEAWQQSKLAGGLYGIRLGRIFFGESMFSLAPNASKAAFITYVKAEQEAGLLQLVDCQTYTPHLESLGGQMIPRDEFLNLLDRLL